MLHELSGVAIHAIATEVLPLFDRWLFDRSGFFFSSGECSSFCERASLLLHHRKNQLSLSVGVPPNCPLFNKYIRRFIAAWCGTLIR
jgi:hypothetical protein